VSSALDTGPRSLHCPACLRETEHHHSHTEETAEGTLSWYRCECGELRSLDFVARAMPTPHLRASTTSDDWWPMSFAPELGGGD
jgi:hypothetical protein